MLKTHYNHLGQALKIDKICLGLEKESFFLFKKLYRQLMIMFINNQGRYKMHEKEFLAKDVRPFISILLSFIYNRASHRLIYSPNLLEQKSNYTLDNEDEDEEMEEEMDKFKDKNKDQHSDYISLSLATIFLFYLSKAEDDYLANINALRGQIDDLNLKIIIAGGSRGGPDDNVRTLINKKKAAESVLQNQQLNRKDVIDKNFKKLFTKHVLNQKSKLDAFNEVNIMESGLRQIEATYIAKAIEKNNVSNRIRQLIINDLKPEQQIPFPVPMKRLNAIIDDRTRHTHVKASGQEVGINEYFVIDNPKTYLPEYCKYPRDESLSLNNKINCRCRVTYFFKSFD